MPVGIVQEKLDGSVGTLLGGRDEWDPESRDLTSGFICVFDQKCKVMPARVGSAAESRWSRAFKLEDCVDQGHSRLKPLSGEAEVRPSHLVHPKYLDIEPPRGSQVLHDDRDMIERLNADGGGVRHEVVHFGVLVARHRFYIPRGTKRDL